MRFEFVNEVKFPEHYDPTKKYTTKVVDTQGTFGDATLYLEFIGTEYNPAKPTCLFPVSESLDDLVHPFVD